MRYFNTHGPVNAQEHYVVPRRALVEQLTVQIAQGKFFTIYAPRQMGKTTLLNQLEAELCPRPTYLPIVLNIDEFDATPQAVLSPLLQTWRTMYLDRVRRPHSLHSVVLVGIQNIARLNVERSSPFNIAYQYRLADFSLAEVRERLAQYTAETGQPIEPRAVALLHEQTGGQPFLVNRAAALLTQDIIKERTRTISMADPPQCLWQVTRRRARIHHAGRRQDDLRLFGTLGPSF